MNPLKRPQSAAVSVHSPNTLPARVQSAANPLQRNNKSQSITALPNSKLQCIGKNRASLIRAKSTTETELKPELFIEVIPKEVFFQEIQPFQTYC